MVCTQIIDLFIPTSGPNVFTDEFNGIKGFGKHGPIPTQPVISQPLINKTRGRNQRGADRSEKLAPTCIPIASNLCLTGSSSSSTTDFPPAALPDLETRLVTESLAELSLSFLSDGGTGVGDGIKPASSISFSTFFERAVATAADSRRVATSSMRK